MTLPAASGRTAATSSAADPTPRPADGLLHPIALCALLVLISNDHLFKAAWPGPLTGKLSDVAGLIVAPLALQASWEVWLWSTGRWRGPSHRALIVAIVAVALGFVAVQVSPVGTEAYRWVLAAAQWPFRALGAIVAGGPIPAIVPVQAIGDAEDLLALPALAISWWVGRRRSARPE